MKRRWLSLAGLLVTLLALSGCTQDNSGGPVAGGTPLLPATMTSSPTPTATPLPTPAPTPVPLPAYQAGVNLLFYADSDWASQLPALVTRLHADNVTCVAFTFPIYQASDTATQVGTGSGTPPDAQLEAVIRTLEGDGFAVMLRPLMDQGDLAPDWRGNISPSSLPAWFASYTQLMVHYATLASDLHVQVMNVGSELYSLEGDTTGWEGVVSAVRTVYAGQVTYSVNGISETGGGMRSGFWGALDFLSVDAYWDLGVPNDATAAQMAAAWEPYLTEMEGAAQGKPVVISEMGIIPVDGEQNTPWKGEQAGATLDPTFQATYYQAACQAASATKVEGLYAWEVNLGTPGDFDPMGQPAEQAMAACFGA
jgi:hypothetical protein